MEILSQLIVPNEETENSYIPEELKYVEVISVTDSDGYDNKNTNLSNDDKENLSSTVTLLVTEEQAKILALLEDISNIHFSLVARENEELKQAFLNKQKEILQNIYPENLETE